MIIILLKMEAEYLKIQKKINNGFGIIVAHEETNVRIKYLIEIN